MTFFKIITSLVFKTHDRSIVLFTTLISPKNSDKIYSYELFLWEILETFHQCFPVLENT